MRRKCVELEMRHTESCRPRPRALVRWILLQGPPYLSTFDSAMPLTGFLANNALLCFSIPPRVSFPVDADD